MNILVTGATGFLGSRCVQYLSKNFNVRTLAKKKSDYNIDLSLQSTKFIEKFDLVIHAAGKAHINNLNEIQSNIFFDVNVNGTFNLLESFTKENLPKYFIFISSVAVYGLSEGKNINENSPLLADDNYGLSKIKAEELILDWGNKNGIVVSILRLPLIVGLNPKGNLASMIRSIKYGYYFNINKGTARRSMVLLTDVIENLEVISKIGGIYNLTDDYDPSFFEISNLIAKSFNKSIYYSFPLFLAIPLAKFGDLFTFFPLNSKKLIKLTSTLTFDCSKAKYTFGWSPKKVIDYEFKSKTNFN